MGRKRKSEIVEQPDTFMGLTTRKFFITLGSIVAGCFLLAYVVVVPGGEWRAADQRDRDGLYQLVKQNYDVDSVGSQQNRLPYGYGLAVAKGTTVNSCRGVSKDDIIAKKPITCDGGYVMQPKP